MKKLLSLILTMAMVMGVCVPAALVSADANSDNLLFSMDLSGSTASNVVVTDSADDSVTENIEVRDSISIGTVEETGTKYLVMDAADDLGVVVTDSAVQNAGKSDITVEMWAKADSGTINGYAEWIFSLGSNPYGVKITRNTNNTIRFASHGDNIKNGTDLSYTDTGWTHLVLTRTYDETTKTGTVTAYMNGKYINSTTKSNINAVDTSSHKMYIGSLDVYHSSWKNAFVGGIGACNVYGKVLTADEVKAKYTDSVEDYYPVDKTGLVFDMDLSGATIVDATADLTDETITKGTASTVVDESIANGSTIKALQLTASSASGLKVVDTAVDAAASSNTMTVESWMKVDATGNSAAGHFLLYTDASANHNWQIMPVVSTVKDVTSMNITNQIHKSSSKVHNNVTYDEWAHYVFTRVYDTTEQTCTLTLYVNGVQEDQQTINNISGPQPMSGGIMHIGGGTYSTGVAMDGSMATFKVYNRALDVNEAYLKYSVEAAKFGHTVADDILITNINWYSGDMPISAINANLSSVSVDFVAQNNTTRSRDLLCALVIYDENKNMVTYDVDKTITLSGNSTEDISLSVSNITPKAGYFARILLWELDTLTPFTDGNDMISYSAEEVHL